MKQQEALLAAVQPLVHQAAVISTDQLKFTEEVREGCKANFCGRYNACWTCPPAVGPLEELKAGVLEWREALVFTTVSPLEDSYDIEGMEAAREEHNRVEERVVKAAGLEAYRVLGAGSCNVCAVCAYPHAPCRFPDKARTSVEACGIDVVRLARTCRINYTNGVNTVTYFSVLLYDRED